MLPIVLGVLLLAIIALPSFISTDFGNKLSLKWLNSRYPGHLKIEKLQLSWLGKQRIEDLTYENPEGKKVASARLIETDTSLLYLLFGGRHLNQTILQDPYLLFEKKEESQSSRKKRSFFTFDNKLFVYNGTVIFDAPKISPITLSDINIEKQATPDVFYIEAKTKQGEVEGELTAEGNLKEAAQFRVNIKKFPVAILDQLVEKPFYTAALGETLNLDMTLGKEGEMIPLKATCESSHLKAFLEGEIYDQKLYLDSKSHLDFTLTPQFFKYLIAPGQEEKWDLASKTNVAIQIENAIFPLDFPKPPLSLQAHAQVERAEIQHKTLGSYSLNQFNIAITTKENIDITFDGIIKGKETTKISATATLNQEGELTYNMETNGFPISLLELVAPDSIPPLKQMIGPNFDLSATGSYYNGEIDTSFSLNSLTAQLNGTVKGEYPEPSFTVGGNLKVVGDKAKIIGPSVQVELDGKVDLKKQSTSISGKLTNPYYEADLRGKLSEALAYDQLHLIITGKVKQFPFEETPIDKGSFFIHVDGSKNLISGKIETAPSHIDANFEIKNFVQNNSLDFKQAKYTFHADLHDIPLSLLNPFMPEGIDLSTIIAKKGSITASGIYSPEQTSVAIKAESTGFVASFSLTVDETGTLTAIENGPNYIHLDLTPSRYNALIKGFFPEHETPFVLTQTAPLTLTITQLVCPTDIPEEISSFLCQSGFTGNINVGTLIFQNPITHESLTLQGLTGSIQGENLSSAIHLNLRGDLFADNVPKTEKSAFSLNASIFNLWTVDGKFNRERSTVKGELSLELLPVRRLMGIMPIQPKTKKTIEAILGDLVNARIYGEISQITGPLTIDIKASNFKAILPLQIYPNSIVLRERIEAEMTLTEEVNEAFLKEINPLLAEGAYSNHPVKVFIDPEGFKVPIRPFNFQGVQADKVVFDLGKIFIYNGKKIQGLLNFLKAPVPHNPYISAWFTPIYLNLKNGVTTNRRFDALIANTVHIAMWGKINLLNNTINMTLGISPATLEQRFNISGLASKDMFQVKMRGSIDDPEFDWSSASTRIAIIMAKTAGGGIGYILGGIVEKIVTAFGEEPSPPPTTSPLPWEKPSR